MKQRRYLGMGWFWFLGTLVPVIGMVQVGMQALADRYTYIPYIGLAVVISWGLADLAGSFAERPGGAGGRRRLGARLRSERDPVASPILARQHDPL